MNQNSELTLQFNFQNLLTGVRHTYLIVRFRFPVEIFFSILMSHILAQYKFVWENLGLRYSTFKDGYVDTRI